MPETDASLSPTTRGPYSQHHRWRTLRELSTKPSTSTTRAALKAFQHVSAKKRKASLPPPHNQTRSGGLPGPYLLAVVSDNVGLIGVDGVCAGAAFHSVFAGGHTP